MGVEDETNEGLIYSILRSFGCANITLAVLV